LKQSPVSKVQEALKDGEVWASVEDAPIIWHIPSKHKDFDIEVGELLGEYKAFARTGVLDKITDLETPFCDSFRTAMQLITGYIDAFRAGGRKIN
jgi:hypothetical protein